MSLRRRSLFLLLVLLMSPFAAAVGEGSGDGLPAAGDANVAQRIAEQTAAIEALSARIDALQARGAAESPPAVGDSAPALRRALNDTERRLRLLIDQFAAAHRLRLQIEDEAANARARNAELGARLQQQQLALQEARLRAEKAEKLHASLEEAHARVATENERLNLELATARERLAEALQQVVTLDSRLAAAKARVGQLQGEAKTLLEQGASAGRLTTGVAAADPAGDAGNEDDAAGDALPGRPVAPRAVTPAVYLVRSDDTLSLISAKVYGDASAWRRIFEANRDVLATPDALAPGMTLVIP